MQFALYSRHAAFTSTISNVRVCQHTDKPFSTPRSPLNCTSRLVCRAISDDDIGDEDLEFIDIPDPTHIILENNFGHQDTSLITDLRAHFDERFSDPLITSGDRFVWDYWHVPGQYSLIRTPADSFFPADVYDRLENALTEFGERVLGCRGISPVWLSYYIDGCRQELHTDSPHGPWAFVLSITEWEQRSFTGGETIILQPQVLDFWREFNPRKGLETPQLQTLVEPRLGQLTVFDPRLPHGVTVVEGVRDPRKARIVLHGWFTAPTPFFTGPINEEVATAVLNNGLDVTYSELASLPPAVGTATVKVQIGGSGAVEGLEFLTNTVMPRPQAYEDLDEARIQILGCIVDNLFALQFGDAMQGGGEGVSVTLPFVFE